MKINSGNKTGKKESHHPGMMLKAINDQGINLLTIWYYLKKINPFTSFNIWFTKWRISLYPRHFLKMPNALHHRLLISFKIPRIWLCFCLVLYCLLFPIRAESSSARPWGMECSVPTSPLNLYFPNCKQVYHSRRLS